MNITAEELLANNIDGLRDALQDDDLYFFYRGVICEFAKELSEIHVTKALKEASGKFDHYSNKNVILNAYPLTNIK